MIIKKNYLIYDFNTQNHKKKINEYIEVLVETLKIPLNRIYFNNNNLTSYISTTTLPVLTDGIANIYFLCDNKKYIVNKVYLDLITIENKKMDNFNNILEETINTYELEFNIYEHGYKVMGMSDFFCHNNNN